MNGRFRRWVVWTGTLILRRSVRLSVTIWVSEVSGAGMHEIAYYDGDDAGEQPLGDIQWLPNDEALSFIYRNVLYTLPAQ